MSVSKSKATDTHLHSESKARKRFLLLYLIFAVLLVGLVSYFYYKSQEQLMFSSQRITMMEYASEQSRKLKQLHRHYPQEKIYPRDSRFSSAIFDLEYIQIFTTLKSQFTNLDAVIYESEDMIHLVRVLDDYYLGAKYLVIEVPQDRIWYQDMMNKIALYAISALLLLIVFGLYLAKVFVRPMHESILLLDRFIKDTTHELNTPLSAILANIEMMETDDMNSSNIKKLNRIEIGARTVSTLYEDLKFLTLDSNKPIDDKALDMKDILQNRLEYFTVLMQSKNIILTTNIEESSMLADRRLIARVIDNILSNAIKYNRRGGKIKVHLSEGELGISDTGIGIPKEKIDSVYERYSRFNDSEGGFGVGLNIVKKIVDHYDMNIDIYSEENKGTKVVLKWEIR
ncbi:MAG TPA: HAMP domain-containing histidine kinase [Sulfurovum sp.]|nr:HAMP domain-containing histidine kinase [Sulfurovum sp.]